MISNQNGLRMIEFFSGIGGMRYATENALEAHRTLKSSHHFSLSSCQAFDISLHANNTYKHNFSHDPAPVRTKLVEQLKPVDLDGKADLWTMSPPCQPFTTTRGAKSLDIDDKRCNGLKAIIELLTKIEEKPKFILLENVKHFADSRMIQEFYKCLDMNEYSYKQYLVSPVQIGVPNHRQRYYILCERSDRWKDEKEIHSEISLSLSIEETKFQQHCVGDYADVSRGPEEEALHPYIVPDSILQKEWARQVGVVTTKDTATHCFTAGYGRIYHKSTGSLLLMRTNDRSITESPLDRSDMMQYSGQLRRFFPSELLRLFGFPSNFEFPVGVNLEHQYKLIGNSINVTVVALLIKELLFGNQYDSQLETRPRPTQLVGGTKGHAVEEIEGNLLKLFHSYRWKMIPNCTGRWTCRDHHKVCKMSPLQLLHQVGIKYKISSELAASGEPRNRDLEECRFQLPGRLDEVSIVSLDTENTTGLITFVKEDRAAFVHTMNTPSGFRRKLGCIGILVTAETITIDEAFLHHSS